MTEFELALRFDSDDHEFVRGVQVGMYWEQLRNGDLPITFVTYSDNAEMMLRMAEARGCDVSSTEGDDEWIEVTFS